MRNTDTLNYGLSAGKRVALFSAIFVSLFCTSLAQAEIKPDVAPEGLVRLEKSKVDYAYLKPGADLSVYKKFILLEAPVSFREDWKKNQQRNQNRRVSDRDIERAENSTAKVFHDTFVKELEKKDAFQIVSEAGPGVLVLKPTVYDLDLVALDSSASQAEVYSKSDGSAALMLEMSDSVSGEVLAVIYDKKKDRRNDFYERSTRVSNARDTRRIFSSWANLLRKSFDGLAKEGADWKI